MKRITLLIGGATALLLSSIPFNIFPLSLVAFVPLFLVAKGEWKRDAGIATLFIFPYYSFHLMWIRNLQAGQELGSIFYLGIFLLFLAKSLAFGIWFAISSRLKTPFQVGLTYAIYEWILEHMGDLGFPWASVFYTSLGFLPFAQSASILGPYFISFLIMGFNYAIYLWIKGRSKRYATGVGIYALSIIMLSLYGFYYMNLKEHSNRFLRVAIIQPNVLPRFEYSPQEWRETQEAFQELQDTLSRLNYDIAIFSESAIIGMLNYDRNREMLSRFLKATRRPLILGSTRMEILKGDERKYYNTAFLIDTSMKVLDYYDKIKIVPFGENLPFYEILPSFIRNMNLGQGDYSRGRRAEPIELDGIRIGVLICYESIFPSLAREIVRNGAQMLAVITNDGWFGRSLGPIEHFHYSRMRAIETGRYLVRSAKTGISAIIDYNGRILKELPQFERGIILYDVPLLEGKTLYVLVGDLWMLLFALVWLGNTLLERKTGD